MLFLQFLREDEADMVERGLILAAIVVAAVALWNTLGTRLAARLNTVVGAVR
jgi:Flp pilus assembly pilin Flp